MRLSAHCAALLALALAARMTTATAAEPTYSHAYTACGDRSDGVTSAILDCIATEYTAQDRRLNVAYRAANKAVPAARRPALVAAQRAWLAYRDAECGFVFDPDGGSMAHVLGNDCLLRMTAERADALEAVRDDALGR